MKSYEVTINGRTYEVQVGDVQASPVIVHVDGQAVEVELAGRASDTTSGESPRAFQAAAPESRQTLPPSPPRPSVQQSAGDGSVRALMPGRIVSIAVSVGQQVQEGDPVLVMESMKMENTVAAVTGGTVSRIHVAEGDSVQHGATLVEIE